MEQNITADGNELDIQTTAESAQPVEELHAADFLTSATAEGTGVSAPDEEQPREAAAQPARGYDQKSIDIGVSSRINAERERLQKSDEYALGSYMLDNYARMHGISKEEARKQLEEDFVKRNSQTITENPETLGRMLMGRNEHPQDAASIEHKDPARVVATRLTEAVRAGELPADLNLEEIGTVYPGFAEAVYNHGVAAAMEIYQAKSEAGAHQMQVRQRAEQARQLPKPLSAQNAVRPASLNYKDMPDSDFTALRQKMRAAAMEGKRII